MRYLVLGSVRVVGSGGEIRLPDRLRLILAVLLCRGGEPASTDALVDAVWGGKPPTTARKNLQVYVHQLRRALGPGVSLPLRDGGYALQVPDDEVDARHFEHLVPQGRQAFAVGDRDRGRQLLRTALALWRGPAYSGITAVPAVREEAARLDESRLTAIEARVDADLASGAAAVVVPELTALVAEHPWREQLVGQLMLALYRTGRQADALRVFRSARLTLADELGIEPGIRLRSLERAILANASELDAPAAVEQAPGPAAEHAGPGITDRPTPAQLPADVPVFTGRADQLRRLDALLPPAGTGAGVTIVAIVGLAGAGKTALAVHWAHRVRERFADGQLFVDLCGYHPSAPPVPAAEALHGFLDALGVAPARVPVGLDAQAGLYRSLLAGKRLLIVLDNARDAQQVRPLLPGTAGSAVLVTSRSRFTSLIASNGAHPLRVGPLPPADARDLLARRLGADRTAAEPGAADALVARCGGLPLALAIVAARAAVEPDHGLAALAAELAGTHLDGFAGEDTATDLRTVISCSYRTLRPTTARLFRLLGLVPGPGPGEAAAASLLGVPVEHIGPPLAELINAHLLTEQQPGRYTPHDLLRVYAEELVHAKDSAADRRAALGRLLDHYLHTAHAAALLISPARRPIALDPPAPGAAHVALTNAEEAHAWFTTERAALLATIRARNGWPPDATLPRLAWALSPYLHLSGRLDDWAAVEQAALDASQRLGDVRGQAHAHRNLSRAYTLLARFDDAAAHAGQALRLAANDRDVAGEAYAHQELSWVLGRRGCYHDALVHARRALRLFEALEHPAGRARALSGVGYCLALVGDYAESLAYCEPARTLFEELCDRKGTAAAWDGIGYAHHHLGRYAHAANCHTRALHIYQEMGDRIGESEALIRLGNAHHARGAPETAREAWRLALTILNDLGHPNADRVRAQLDAPDTAGALHWPHR
jgi:DNA-binding SARP family transcriptional activator/tetratricopeptide (TPR) repeat protein